MAMQHQPHPSRENTYVNDPESSAEMARLLDQDKIITTCMGGLLPEQGDAGRFRDVLDIACGPGGWAQEVAFAHPQIQVTGVDISRAMIEYARVQARLQDLGNANFAVMDATAPLDFPDGTFDLVNARLISGFMLTRNWAPLVAECRRVLRPGGVLRLTETDIWGVSNKPAFETLMAYAYRASWLTGHSFDSSGRTFGITPMLERLMRLAGLREIKSIAHAVNFSTGSLAWQSMTENFRVFFKLVQPFEIRARETLPDSGMPNQAELDRLYDQMLEEMIQDDFVGIFYLLTVWGVRPGADDPPGVR
jgi:ubiquinone/menaquinone biosynthesis C-methylase UbiE